MSESVRLVEAGQEEAVEEARPIPLILVLGEAARLALRDMRVRLAERLDQLNRRLSRPKIVSHGTDWIGRTYHVVVRAGPLGPTERERYVVQY